MGVVNVPGASQEMLEPMLVSVQSVQDLVFAPVASA